MERTFPTYDAEDEQNLTKVDQCGPLFFGSSIDDEVTGGVIGTIAGERCGQDFDGLDCRCHHAVTQCLVREVGQKTHRGIGNVYG